MQKIAEIWELVKKNRWFLIVLCILVLAVYIVTHYFYGFVVVDGDSMNNTLYHNQIGVIQKFGVEEEIQRGDIIVFYSDKLEEYVIKRCVAVGGDTLYMSHGFLHVNDQLVRELYMREPMVKNYNIKKMTLAKDQYFAMGDNRNESLDCRELGPTDAEHVVGKLICNLGEYGITRPRVLIAFAVLVAFLVVYEMIQQVLHYQIPAGETPEECREFPIVIESSVCTGERYIGFRNPKTKKLMYMEMVTSEEEIVTYCMKYGRNFDEFVQK